eukprot:Nitzschia sp. Nitz4//scaffold13_size275219//232604//234484//NITZ4_000916-RA/size275219-snap-gene-0.62-mRNA-1//-1//CDS//3329536140//3388//frame0
MEKPDTRRHPAGWQKHKKGCTGVLLVGLLQLVLVVLFENEILPLDLAATRVFYNINEDISGRVVKLLLGIDCSDNTCQNSIRATYFQFYNTTGSRLGLSPKTLCPWNNGGDGYMGFAPGCRIVYTFFRISDDCSTSPTLPDVICVQTKPTTGKSISSEVAWLQWASKHLTRSTMPSIAWRIGYTEKRAMLQPPLLLDVLDHQDMRDDRGTSASFATTDSFLDLGRCSTKNAHFRYLLCDRVPQAKVYWMSQCLLPLVLDHLKTSGISNDEDVGPHIRRTVEVHLQLEQLPPPSILLNTLPVERLQWQGTWEHLLSTVTNEIPPTPGLLWKNLPCFFVTAKFGPTPETFQSDVLKRRVELLWNYGVTPTHLATYYDFPTWILEDPTWAQHLEFRHKSDHPAKRGAGFWFWKALLIQHHLREFAVQPLNPHTGGEDNLLLYTDLDVFGHMEWFPTFFESFREVGYDMAIYQMIHKETQYTTGVVLNEVCGLAVNVTGLLQYSASILLFRNTAASRQLVDDWVETVKHYGWISGRRDPAFSEPDDFIDHRHDQSVLSTLLHCRYVNSTDVYTGRIGTWGDTTLGNTLHMIRLKKPEVNKSISQEGRN